MYGYVRVKLQCLYVLTPTMVLMIYECSPSSMVVISIKSYTTAFDFKTINIIVQRFDTLKFFKFPIISYIDCYYESKVVW